MCAYIGSFSSYMTVSFSCKPGPSPGFYLEICDVEKIALPIMQGVALLLT